MLSKQQQRGSTLLVVMIVLISAISLGLMSVKQSSIATTVTRNFGLEQNLRQVHNLRLANLKTVLKPLVLTASDSNEEVLFCIPASSSSKVGGKRIWKGGTYSWSQSRALGLCESKNNNNALSTQISATPLANQKKIFTVTSITFPMDVKVKSCLEKNRLSYDFNSKEYSLKQLTICLGDRPYYIERGLLDMRD